MDYKVFSKIKRLSFMSVCLASSIFTDLVFGIEEVNPMCTNISSNGICNTKFQTPLGSVEGGFHFIALNNSKARVGGKNVADSLDSKGLLYYTNMISEVSKTNFVPQSTYVLTLSGTYEMLDTTKGQGHDSDVNAIAPFSNLIITTGTGTLRDYGVNINELAIGMGNSFLSPLDADIKNSYGVPSSLTILQQGGDEDSSIIFNKRLYVNNGSKISVDAQGDEGEIRFKAKMQTSIVLPDIRFYDMAGEFKRELYQTSLNDEDDTNLNTTNSIGQNLELEFKAKTFKNTGQLYISGARQSKDYSYAPLDQNLHSLTNITLYAPPPNGYGFDNGSLVVKGITKVEAYHSVGEIMDAFNNNVLSGGDGVRFVDDPNWEEGRITVRDFAQLNITGNVFNHGNGTIALFDGGVLNINGNFKNEGWIVSGAIDSRHFGYIDVKKVRSGLYNEIIDENTGKSILNDKSEFALMSRADNPLYGNKAYPILQSEGGISFIQNIFDSVEEEWDTAVTEDVSKGLKNENIHILSGNFVNGSLQDVKLAENFSSSLILATPTLSDDKKTLYISLSLTDEAKKKNISQLIAEADANLLLQKMITKHEKKVQTDVFEIKANEQKLGFLKDRVDMYTSLFTSTSDLDAKKQELQTAKQNLEEQKQAIETRKANETQGFEQAIISAQAIIDDILESATNKNQAKETIRTNKASIEQWKKNNYYYNPVVLNYISLENKIKGLEDIAQRYETEKTALHNLEEPVAYHNSAKDTIQKELIKAKTFYFQNTLGYANSLLSFLKAPSLDYQGSILSEENESVNIDGKVYQVYYPSLIQADFNDFDPSVFEVVKEEYAQHSTNIDTQRFSSLVSVEELNKLKMIYANYIDSKVYFSKQDFEEIGDKFDNFSEVYAQKVLSLTKALRKTQLELEAQVGTNGVIESNKKEALADLTTKYDYIDSSRDEISEKYTGIPNFFTINSRLLSAISRLSPNNKELWDKYQVKFDVTNLINTCQSSSSEQTTCILTNIESIADEQEDLGEIKETFKLYILSKIYTDLNTEKAKITRQKTSFDDSVFDKEKMEKYGEYLPQIEELLEIVKKGAADKAGFIQEVLASILESNEPQSNEEKILNGLKNLEGIDVVVINHILDSQTLDRMVSNVDRGIKTLSETQSKNTAQKAVSLVTSTLTSNRLAMLSNPITPDASLSELIQRMSKQRYAENEAGDVKTDVFLSLQEPQAVDKGNNMQLWGSVIGGYASADGNSSIYGGSVGYDAFIRNNWILGGYATYAYVSSKAKGGEITNNSHNAQLGLYSRVIMGEANELDIFVSHNVGFVHQNRDMKILDIHKQESDYVSQSSDIGLKYGYVFGIGKDKPTFFIKPYVGGDLLINVLGKYKEKGLAFEQEGQTNTQVNVGAGLELRKYFKDGGFFFITPGVDARVYDSQDNMVYKLGGQEIISDIVKKTDVYFVAIVGGEFKMTQSLFGFGSLGAKVNGDENYFNGTIGVRYKF